MFHYFFLPLVEDFNFLNLFNYLTFRAGGALFTAFLISILLGPKLIKGLKKLQKKRTTNKRRWSKKSPY